MLLCVACSRGGDARGDTAAATTAAPPSSAGPVAAGGDLRWRNETYRELDGDEENAERLVATVSKGSLDSTIVRLEIRTSKDKILYRHEWPAVAYMMYKEAGAAKDSVKVLRETQLQLTKLFDTIAFLPAVKAMNPSGAAQVDLDAIRYDIAEHEYRTAKSMKRWERLPPRAYDELNIFARAVPLARIQTVAADTRDKLAFRYYAGGEETYSVAWSPSEGRMVRIAACC